MQTNNSCKYECPPLPSSSRAYAYRRCPYIPSPGCSAEVRPTVVTKDIPYTPRATASSRTSLTSPHSPFLCKHKLNRLDFKPAERKPDRHRFPRLLMSTLLAGCPLQRECLRPRVIESSSEFVSYAATTLPTLICKLTEAWPPKAS
jgi:hypothetical protein